MSNATVFLLPPESSGPAGQWAAERLLDQLRRRGVVQAPREEAGVRIVVCRSDELLVAPLVGRWRQKHGQDLTAEPESFAIQADGQGTLLVCGADDRGLSYALLELCDVARYADDVTAALTDLPEHLARPRNPVRGVTRMFTTATTDLEWLHDRDFWREYLTELAGQRINTFSLGLGAGYDYLIDRQVTDNYLCLPYPFLLEVEGYAVSARGVDQQERSRNLSAVQFIGSEATRRGISFGLGLWNHAYRYDPDADTERWPIRGLDRDNHASYCRDALTALLQSCPDVRRLTFRVHFEGGVPEPTQEFWRVVLSELPTLGRQVELDFHAKGVSEELIQIALDTGMPLTLSTKHWGEHQGLPYHQASIRQKERGPGRGNPEAQTGSSPGTGHPEGRAAGTTTTTRRSFTRYGYGDYAAADRPYSLLHRVWPGTQRVLLWGDPVLAAGYGELADFAGARGLEWFEPLSFYGKKDSAVVGSPGGPHPTRQVYRDERFQIASGGWRKATYTYRLLGRTAYDPSTPLTDLIRPLAARYGSATSAVVRATGAASRVLPLITVAHAPSTACNVYWPEMPTPVPLVESTGSVDHRLRERHGWPPNANFDMTPPYTFGHVSPLDPELIYGVDEFAADLVAGRRQGKHTPPEIADRLDQLSRQALAGLEEAKAVLPPEAGSDFAVLATDVKIQAQLASHFAALTRAALAFALREHGAWWADRARKHYAEAAAAWAALVAAAEPYAEDLPFGQTAYSRGTWSDREPALTADLAAVDSALRRLSPGLDHGRPVPPDRLRYGPRPAGEHQPPDRFVAHQPLRVCWRTEDRLVSGVRLHCRPVNQSLDYEVVDLVREGNAFFGDIPITVTSTPYPVQYFFVVSSAEESWPYPGLHADLANQPYFVVHAHPGTRWGRALPS